MPAADSRALLQRQLGLEWRFARDFILGRIDDELALWSPVADPCTVRRTDDGWAADWPDEDGDTPAIATIAWILWHIEWWWADTLSRVGGGDPLPPAQHLWSGGTDQIEALKRQWDDVLASDDLDRRISWVLPEPQPLCMIASWLNFELAKNLSEINQLKMLRAALGRRESETQS